MKHEIIDDGDPRYYWTQIPNIVFDIGLSAYEILLYCHLKRIAGDYGKCFKSTRTLSKECGVSPAVIVRTKMLLTASRPDLNGKPLIKIKELSNPSGGKDYHEITITDIWKANTNRYSRDDDQVSDIALDKQVSQNEGASVIQRVKQVPDMTHKKNTLKKNTEEEPNALAKFKSDPLYKHVDVEREFQKAERWAEVHHKKVTPRFFVNWLNRIDAPFRPNGNGRTYVDDEWDKAKTMTEIKAMVEA